ncbi:hypothetical protein PFISCL1PPCAC_19198 [Pristionchus fissidentatus]|uniref:F-box domain-containing protein n=1 Tax=Pristionchus fissidentatus TaxID=1538716 RepID=A0AAV5W6U9_9BILA|nr:hypothetical protein PFISCL1PPCAC_19198 [Pristionchus fissidentatus]
MSVDSLEDFIERFDEIIADYAFDVAHEASMKQLADHYDRMHKDSTIKTITEDYPKEFATFLLDLPNEIIAKILFFLPIPSRLNARVSKRLNEVEARAKFATKSLNIAKSRGDLDP